MKKDVRPLRVLITAPFSLNETWSDRPWPFLSEFKRIFGEENVEFVGHQSTASLVKSNPIERVIRRWLPIIKTARRTTIALRKFDIIVV